MKLNRREIVLLLNGLMVQQNYHNHEDKKAPKATDFTSFEDAYNLIMGEQDENPYVVYKEFDDIFSKLVYHAQHDLTPEEEGLLNLPATELQ